MTSKVFIVTGASKGIGAAISRRLLKQSHKVVLGARSEELLQGTKKSHPSQVEYVAGDLTDPKVAQQLVDTAVESFGKIDGIILNHGTLAPKRLADSTVDEFKRVYDINVFSYLTLAKAALNEVKKSKGCIVWLSSGAAAKPYVAWGAYGSSKSAINALSAHLAAEEPDVTSVAVAPGRVNTDMQAELRSEGRESMSKAQYDGFVDAFNQGGLLRPDQPGDVIANLVAEPSKELSGKFLSWNAPELAAYLEK